MAKERLFELPETKGSFQLRGIVTGCSKDGFYKEDKTSTNKDRRTVNFGVEVEKEKTLYVNLQGMVKDEVVFSKQAEKKGDKSETIKVKWSDRHTFKRDKFRLIGCNIGVTKITDAEGKVINDKKLLTEFDACKEVGTNLKDDVSVFIKGKTDFSSSRDGEGNVKRYVKLIPNQISLCKDIDFTDIDYEVMHHFTQLIIFMGIEQEKVKVNDDLEKPTGRYVVSAKIVNYSSIEDAEFIIIDNKLATLFKKNLKPYTGIEVFGKLDASTETEEVKSSDELWGEENTMSKVKAPTKREFIITGANPSSIDVKTYSKELVEQAIEKIEKAKKATDDYADETDSGWNHADGMPSNDEAIW